MSSYADEWAKWVHESRDSLRWGTEAHHELGDISRPKGDYVRVDQTYPVDEDGYTGHWLTGFGFINVRLPAATTRPLSDDEIEWLAEHPVVIA